jgi:SAM-dependent methyltransferase
MFGILNRAPKSHASTLDRLIRKAGRDTAPHQLFHDVSDEFWLWAVTEGYRTEDRLRAILPSYPPEEVQCRFAGASGDDTMRDAFAIHQLVKSLAAQHLGRPLESVLEFGCGWGRIVRLFVRDVAPDRLWGIDCLPAAIEICKTTNPHATFRLVDPFPPTTIADGTFDLVYAYSVFSHLSEAAHLAWLGEFNRILKPGGLLVATTRGREFILQCAEARAKGEQRDWAMGTVLSFQDTDDALARYDRGEYVYEPLGGGDVLDASFYGETCIPERYVRDRWSPLFEFVGYLDDRRLCQQNVAVARKA